MPAILEATQASDYSSFTAFREDIENRYLSISGDTVKYEASDGSIIEVNFGVRYDGNNIKIDDKEQAAELENYPTFESPYVNSDWDSGYIVISKDEKKCILDFRDSDNPIKIIEIDGQVTVIPEFQIWTLVPIFLIVSVIVILTKKLRAPMPSSSEKLGNISRKC